MATSANDAEAILQVISSWPSRDQLLLAQRILDQVLTTGGTTKRTSWQELAGLAAPDGPAPDDARVSAWLEEHRLEKYG
jgi:hypothetical protein